MTRSFTCNEAAAKACCCSKVLMESAHGSSFLRFRMRCLKSLSKHAICGASSTSRQVAASCVAGCAATAAAGESRRFATSDGSVPESCVRSSSCRAAAGPPASLHASSSTSCIAPHTICDCCRQADSSRSWRLRHTDRHACDGSRCNFPTVTL